MTGSTRTIGIAPAEPTLVTVLPCVDRNRRCSFEDCHFVGTRSLREPRRVEVHEQSRRPLAAINKVVGETVNEDPDRWSQSSAGREHKMKGNFLRAPTGEYPNQASFSDRSHDNFSR